MSAAAAYLEVVAAIEAVEVEQVSSTDRLAWHRGQITEASDRERTFVVIPLAGPDPVDASGQLTLECELQVVYADTQEAVPRMLADAEAILATLTRLSSAVVARIRAESSDWLFAFSPAVVAKRRFTIFFCA